jgi:hypothetical protein
VCYDSYDDDDEVHHVEVMNDVVIQEYMIVDSDVESIVSCNDSEEESDGSEGSIINEYEGDEFDNDVVGEIDDMYIEGGKDELDDLLVYTDPSDFPLNDNTCDDGFELSMPTTNAGECTLEVEEVVVGSGQRVQGHVILNQAFTLLSRQDKTIRGYSGQKHFLQKLAAVDNGKCIPLLYSEAMMYLSKNSLGGSTGNNPMCPYKIQYVNKVQELRGKIEIGEGSLYNPINLKFHLQDH